MLNLFLHRVREICYCVNFLDIGKIKTGFAILENGQRLLLGGVELLIFIDAEFQLVQGDYHLFYSELPIVKFIHNIMQVEVKFGHRYHHGYIFWLKKANLILIVPKLEGFCTI